MRKLTVFFVLIQLFNFFSNSVFADTFAVQGVLRDPLGKTVADGHYSMTFRLFTQATGGTAVWEETQGSVAVLHGVYSAELGAANPLDDVTFNTTYWLGLSINGGTELEPRFKLTKAPASMSVLGTDNVFPSKGNIGVGTHTPTAAFQVKNKNNAATVLLVEDANGNPQLKSNASGQLGVGTSPTATLHVKNSASATTELLVEDNTGNTHVKVTNDSKVGIGTAPAADLHIKTANTTDKMLIEGADGTNYVVVDGTGKLGVKVDAPTQTLDINGNIKMRNGGIMFDDGSTLTSAKMGGSASSVSNEGTTLITSDSDNNGTGNIDLITGSTTRMSVNSSGKIGIGTSNPTTLLHMKGTTATDAILFVQPGEFNSAGDYAELRLGHTDHYIRGEYATGMTFYDADGFNFSGGNVGIGISKPLHSLHVKGKTTASSILFEPSAWSTGNSLELRLGDQAHYIKSTYGTGMTLYDADGFLFAGGHTGFGTDYKTGLLNFADNKALLFSPGSSSYYSGLRYDSYFGSLIFAQKSTSAKMRFAIGHDITTNHGISGNIPSSPEMTIADGKVGINKDSPGYTLDVGGNINFTGTLYQNGSQFQTSKWSSSGSILYYTGGVSIGTSNYTTTNTALNIAESMAINLRPSGSSYTGGFRWSTAGSEYLIIAGKHNDTKVLFDFGWDITGNESYPSDPVANINKNGIGINNSNALAPVHIKQTSANYGLRIEQYGSSNHWDVCFSSTDDNLNFLYKGTVKNYMLTADGSWGRSSDIRLKKNLRDLEPALNKLLNIKTYRYQYKGEDVELIGFVAQDLEKYYPEFVSENNGYKGISYASLTPVLVKAIQEQQKIIDEQKNELKELKSQMIQAQSSLKRLEVLISTLEKADKSQRGD